MNISRFCLQMVMTSALGLAIIPAASAIQPEIGFVENLTLGDRACYVDLIDEAGNVSTQFARFEICEQDLLGQEVFLTYEYADIIAESCQGAPECSDTETVLLITQADILDAALTQPSDDYPTFGIVQDMVAGDRACYVDLIDEAGNVSTQFARFEICEQDLLGQTVELYYELGTIVAESCNGDIGCGLSDTVMFITDAVIVGD